ncbi:MAG: gamma-glutamyltransferase [Planctomycetia bacterium]|nr:gamma-glutamyltransferase [Planctomycetia bacterium]
MPPNLDRPASNRVVVPPRSTPRVRASAVAALTLALVTTTRADGLETFARHVVVAQEGNAAGAGRDAMRRGGNAVDAAVATAFALAVTHPAAGNLGGGGFLVAFDARSGRVRSFDFRETAPAASTPTMYLGPDGTLPPRHRAGPRAAGVPGTVRGLGLAHAGLGKLPWADLVAPAARLARDGFVISDTLARSLNAQFAPRGALADAANSPGGRKVDTPGGVLARRDDLGPDGDRLADFPQSVAAFGKPDGTPWRGGDRLVQPDLADTLDRLARHGPDEFYTGRTADLIAAEMRAHGGLITRDDLDSYRARERPPVHTTYRGHDVYGVGPPASGGIVVAEMLGVLETYDLRADGPRSPRTLHRVTEAQRRAFFTRATRVADPDFVAVPVAELISRNYTRKLASTISDTATPSASLAPFPVMGAEGPDTTHLSTLDSARSA